MCGRFTNRLTWREIVALYRLAVPVAPERNLPARYNICPTDTVDVVVPRNGGRDLVPMRWGLVPAWWKKRLRDVPSTFNARAETLATKPMFRDAFRSRRCLIPASGYYEWLPTPTGKQPYYYTARDDAWLTGRAGLERLKPAPDGYLQAWPVARRVNSSRAPSDDPTLIDRVAA